VSRRAIRFVENKPLTLKIALKNACNGVACGADQTCVDGSCTGYSVLDTASCGADGCGDGVLPKSNGIPLPPSPLVCGDMGGLQPGAAWPMLGGCPTHPGRSAYTGPSFSHTRWTFTAGAPISSGVAIAADGTIYFGADDHKLYAVDKDGRLKWATPIATDVFDTTVPAITADGTIVIGSIDTNLYAVSPRGDLLWTHTIGGKQTPSPAIGGDGTLYVGGGSGQSKVFALDKTGAEKWNFPTGSTVYASPALGFAGTIHIGSEDDTFYTLGLDGKERWRFAVGEGNTSASIGANGSIYFVGKGSVCALDKDGKLLWVNPTKGDSTLPSIGADGSMYIATSGGWLYGIGPDGKYLWNKQVTTKFNGGNQAVIGGNGAIYIGALDNIFYAFEPTGDVLWQLVTGGPIRGPAALGADGTLYFGSQDGKLYAVGSP
jgi:outer membrane protein assembly factor BamB